MEEDVWKSFFVNLQAGILQLHYRLTSSQIVFGDFKISFKIFKNLTCSNDYLPFLYKILEKLLWKSFLLYLGVEIVTETLYRK